MFLKEMCEYRIGHELFFLCEISICKLCSITYSSNVKNELPHGFSYFLVIWSPWIIFSLFWEVPDCDQGRPSLQADHHADCVGPHLAEGASSCGGTGRDREGASTEPKMRLCGAISVARHGFAAARLPPRNFAWGLMLARDGPDCDTTVNPRWFVILQCTPRGWVIRGPGFMYVLC